MSAMQFLKPLPHVLVTLDLDVPVPRWVVGYVDQQGLWYVRASKRATDCAISPKRRAKIDDVEDWLSDVLDIETAALRRIVDAPCPTWSVVAQADADLPVPAPTESPETMESAENESRNLTETP